MTQTKTLTMEQAIEKGYTHFVEEEGERMIPFSSIKETDIIYFREVKCFIVDMTTPKHYSIDAKTIADLISDHVFGQEEMADENGDLEKIAESHDYSKVAEELNAKFAELKYYEPTDIEVTF